LHLHLGIKSGALALRKIECRKKLRWFNVNGRVVGLSVNLESTMEGDRVFLLEVTKASRETNFICAAPAQLRGQSQWLRSTTTNYAKRYCSEFSKKRQTSTLILSASSHGQQIKAFTPRSLAHPTKTKMAAPLRCNRRMQSKRFVEPPSRTR
jgi:hypothetical protein